jgi:tripartite-type tricarboxylate transporter receptor subunit TctC
MTMFDRFGRDFLCLFRQTVRAFMTLACVLVATAAANTQEAPAGSPSVTIVHPFAPGGVGYDLGQVMGDRFRRLFKTSVIVEAKPGANTLLGVTSVVKSKLDGQTLLINSTAITAIAGAIYNAPPYNPATDLVPVAFVAQVPLVLVVSGGLPVKSINELVNRDPGQVAHARTEQQYLFGDFQGAEGYPGRTELVRISGLKPQ